MSAKNFDFISVGNCHNQSDTVQLVVGMLKCAEMSGRIKVPFHPKHGDDAGLRPSPR